MNAMHAPRIQHTTCDAPMSQQRRSALMAGLILSDQDRTPDPCQLTTLTMMASPLAVIGPGLFALYTTATSQCRSSPAVSTKIMPIT